MAKLPKIGKRKPAPKGGKATLGFTAEEPLPPPPVPDAAPQRLAFVVSVEYERVVTPDDAALDREWAWLQKAIDGALFNVGVVEAAVEQSRARMSPVPPPVDDADEGKCDRCDGTGHSQTVDGALCDKCDGTGRLDDDEDDEDEGGA